MRNVAHRKQRLPVLPLLQRDVSFAAHELVEHRAHLCRHLFLLHAQKKGGRGLPFGKGRVKSVKRRDFFWEKILRFRRRFIFFFSSSKARLLRVFRFLPFETHDTTRRRDLSVSISIYLSIYLSLPPSLSFPSSRAIGSVCVSSEGAWNSREQRRSALADDGVDATFPSSLRIVYRPLLFGEKFGFDAVDSRFSDKVV